jgi:hypothetical protein
LSSQLAGLATAQTVRTISIIPGASLFNNEARKY